MALDVFGFRQQHLHFLMCADPTTADVRYIATHARVWVAATPVVSMLHRNVDAAFHRLLGGSLLVHVTPYPARALPLLMDLLAAVSHPHCNVWAERMMAASFPEEHEAGRAVEVLDRLRAMFPDFGFGPSSEALLLRLSILANMVQLFPGPSEPVHRVRCCITFCPHCGCELRPWAGAHEALHGRQPAANQERLGGAPVERRRASPCMFLRGEEVLAMPAALWAYLVVERCSFGGPQGGHVGSHPSRWLVWITMLEEILLLDSQTPQSHDGLLDGNVGDILGHGACLDGPGVARMAFSNHIASLFWGAIVQVGLLSTGVSPSFKQKALVALADIAQSGAPCEGEIWAPSHRAKPSLVGLVGASDMFAGEEYPFVWTLVRATPCFAIRLKLVDFHIYASHPHLMASFQLLHIFGKLVHIFRKLVHIFGKLVHIFIWKLVSKLLETSFGKLGPRWQRY